MKYSRMYTAIANNGQKVTATEAIHLEEKKFTCSQCGGSVHLRNGLVKVEHFGHNPGNSCAYSQESLEHISMKSQIYNNLKKLISSKVINIELEKNLGTCRPDIYIEGRKSLIAIEVQTSSLSPSQILLRTEKYHDMGVYVLWVIPYDLNRITKYNSMTGQRQYSSFRLKEYERIISFMYFKTLILWDIHRNYLDGFILLQLKDVFTEGIDFYSKDRGEHVSFEPRKLKMIKQIAKCRSRIQLSDFLPKHVNAYDMPNATYSLPERLIMYYDWKKKN